MYEVELVMTLFFGVLFGYLASHNMEEEDSLMIIIGGFVWAAILLIPIKLAVYILIELI